MVVVVGAAKRRGVGVTDSDSASLPSGTFTSDEEDDADDVDDDRSDDSAATRDRRRFAGRSGGCPAAGAWRRPRLVATSPRRDTASPAAACRRRRPSVGWDERDVSSGALGDRSSSVGTSGGDLGHAGWISGGAFGPGGISGTPGGDVARGWISVGPGGTSSGWISGGPGCGSAAARKTATAASRRRNSAERRRAVLRRVTRMSRRLHRVAAAAHVQTLAVL